MEGPSKYFRISGLLFPIVKERAQESKSEHKAVGKHRAVSVTYQVVGKPENAIADGPQAVGFAGFLSNTADKSQASQNGDQVCRLGIHKEVDTNKSGGINANEPFGNGLFFSLKEEVDGGLNSANGAGNTAIISAG